MSEQYGLTFVTPPGAFYCPLAKDWTGSDHGTTLFLAPPARCGGAGFPSSSRGFEPGSTPRIEVFYSYREADEGPYGACKGRPVARFLGRLRPLCVKRSGDSFTLSVAADYRSDTPAQALFTLVTTPSRLAGDRAAFLRLAAATRPCTASWEGGKNGRFTTGQGPACPRKARWF